MASDEANEERRRSRSRAKSLSVGDLRSHNRGTRALPPSTLPITSTTASSNRNEAPQADTDPAPAEIFVPDMPSFVEAPTPPESDKADPRRLIIIANRLPITVKRTEEGTYDLLPSAGGLVSGLAGMMRTSEFLWYGWPGLEVPQEDMDEVRQRCWNEHKCIPVFMSEELSDRHYNGFSNEILWPLFHYHPDGVDFNDSAWEAYRQANRLFAKAVAADLKDDDIVWVQDYHLMLLPMMLREEVNKRTPRANNVKIGFFLHTPFPSSEIYRILPTREDLLYGVLHCDLIGFHTIDYARHFLNSCTRVLGLPASPNGVHFDGKYVTVQEFPIGIDPQKFTDGLQHTSVVARIGQLKKRFDGVKVIVGVDRLDYIKGVQQKLHALEVFLTDHPEWIGKVVLIQVAVPSRGEVEDYKELRKTVNELVGRINGQFGTIEFTPIHFLHKSVTFNELIALYAVSDACLVTSTRDGMNLVSYEYIACQQERHGVMILSEFAGAAQSLNGALIVNPWDAQQVAEELHTAVTMSPEARKANFEKLWARVSTRTSCWWGDTFVGQIKEISMRAQKKLKVRRRESAVNERVGRKALHSLPTREDSIAVYSSDGGDEVGVKLVESGKLPQREDEEKYSELYEEDEGIVLKTSSRSPPPME